MGARNAEVLNLENQHSLDREQIRHWEEQQEMWQARETEKDRLIQQLRKQVSQKSIRKIERVTVVESVPKQETCTNVSRTCIEENIFKYKRIYSDIFRYSNIFNY